MNEIVSIVGGSYFDPISTLLEKLKDCYEGNEEASYIGERQNGYAASTCLLSVVCLESYVMRSRYISSATGRDLNKVSVNTYIENIYSDYPYYDETNEIFVVRDVLAHNHLINMPFSRNKDGEISIGDSIRASSGDNKFADNVNQETGKTKILGLSTNPVEIGYKDASIVLKTVWKNLIYLENKDKNQCYVSHLRVKHEDNRILFGELIETL